MERLRTLIICILYTALLCCILLKSTHIGIAENNEEKWEGIDIMSDLKTQAYKILYWSRPNKLVIIPYKFLSLQGRPVFCCLDECGNSVVLAKDNEGGWLRLSGGGDFSGMNKILKDNYYAKNALNNKDYLMHFLELFHSLYLRNEGVVLSQEFITSYGDDFTGWLHLDRDVAHLKALCNDPVVETEGDTLKIAFNVLSFKGSVEHWTLYGKHKDEHVSVDQLTISVLRPIGTYLYAIMGSTVSNIE